MPSWLSQSLLGVVFVTPAWLAIPFFAKNFGVTAPVFLCWYLAGVVLASASYGIENTQDLFPSWWLILAMLALGFTFGGMANVKIFSAVADPANGGMAVAVQNLAGFTTFIAAAALYRAWPEWFAEVEVNWQPFVGVLFLAAGMALISVKIK